MISVGAVAPDFELPRPRLSDFREKEHVVLAFYPLDFSPTCSTEHGCFKDASLKLGAASAQVLGISVDSAWAHQAFAEQMGIGDPLLADFHFKGAVAEKFWLYDGSATPGSSSRSSPARLRVTRGICVFDK